MKKYINICQHLNLLFYFAESWYIEGDLRGNLFWILNKQNSIDLKRNGTVYYLDRALDKLARGGRPLSLKDGVETIYEKRKDLYAFATDIAVDNNGEITETVKKIEKDFLKWKF